jgi:hypothetical protein
MNTILVRLATLVAFPLFAVKAAVADMPPVGALIACSLMVTDRGDCSMLLRPAANPGTLAVQPTWPCIELSP